MSQQMPQTPVIARQTYASPMSFVGSARRIGAWASRGGGGVSALKWVLGVFAILVMWSVVSIWYVIVFGLFGIFTFPYRFIRRGHRKSLAVQKTQLATMQTMMVQQQEQMAQQQEGLARQQEELAQRQQALAGEQQATIEQAEMEQAQLPSGATESEQQRS